MNNRYPYQWLVWCLLFILGASIHPTSLNGQSNGISFDEFMGINMRREDPIDRLKAVHFIREYHEWPLDEGLPHLGIHSKAPYQKFKWNPSYQGQTPERFDDMYQKIVTEEGLQLVPNLMWTTSYAIDPYGKLLPWDIQANLYKIMDQMPIALGYGNTPAEDPFDPQSYSEHATWVYHYALRYGTTSLSNQFEQQIAVPRLHEDELENTPYTGKGLIHYLESWNEQDKNWLINQGYPNTYFRPGAYAAMLSADYDGHMGQILDEIPYNQVSYSVGAKNADSNIKMVMGGLAGLKVCYVDTMLSWFEENRTDPDFPVYPLDVINFHHYSNNFGQNLDCSLDQIALGNIGISPEQDQLKQRLIDVKAELFAKHPNLPTTTEFWLSEFGYDTNPYSPQRVPEINSNGIVTNRYEVQASWIVRSFLEIAAAGWSRAMLYEIRDLHSGVYYNGNNQPITGPFPYLYKACGLLMDKSHNLQPKPSWYYVYTLKNTLENMEYKKDLTAILQDDPNDPSDNPNSAEDNIRIYQFEDQDDPSIMVYAIWSPTAKNRMIPSYPVQLNIDENTPVTLVELQTPDINGKESALNVTPDGEVFVDISERPIFLKVNVTAQSPMQCVGDLETTTSTCNSITLRWKVPTDAEKFHVYRTAQISDPVDSFDDLIDPVLVGEGIEAGSPGSLQEFIVGELAATAQYTFVVISEGPDANFSDICYVNGTTSNYSCLISPNSFTIVDEANGAYNAINPDHLFDEQQSVPICQVAGNPVSEWGELWLNGPANTVKARIEFDEPHFIEGIYLYDGYGQVTAYPFRVEYENPDYPGLWHTVVSYQPTKVNEWVSFFDLGITKPVLKLRFIKTHAQARINEIGICGYPSSGIIDPNQEATVEISSTSCTSSSLNIDLPDHADPGLGIVLTFDGNQSTIYNNSHIWSDLEPGSIYEFTVQYYDQDGLLRPLDPAIHTILTKMGGSADCFDCECEMIPLKTNMITMVQGGTIWDNGPENLFDEQNNLGNPICGDPDLATSVWEQPWGASIIYIDLGDQYQVHGISYFDGPGIGNMKIKAGTPDNFNQPVLDFATQKYNEWVTYKDLNLQTQYLQLEKIHSGAKIGELFICVNALGQGGGGQQLELTEQSTAEEDIQISISPNPVRDQLNLSMSRAGFVHLTIFDSGGLAVYETGLSPAVQNLSVPVAQLPRGAYIVQLDRNDSTLTKSFVIQ